MLSLFTKAKDISFAILLPEVSLKTALLLINDPERTDLKAYQTGGEGSEVFLIASPDWCWKEHSCSLACYPLSCAETVNQTKYDLQIFFVFTIPWLEKSLSFFLFPNYLFWLI